MVLGKKRKENRFIQFECLRMLPFFCDFGQEVERMGEPTVGPREFRLMLRQALFLEMQ